MWRKIWNLLHYQRFSLFRREIVLSRFTRYCVEKIWAKNCARGEKITNIRFSWRVSQPIQSNPKMHWNVCFGSLYIGQLVHLCWMLIPVSSWYSVPGHSVGGLPDLSSTLVHHPINPIGLFRHLLEPCNCMHTAHTNLPIVVKRGIFIIEMGVNYMVWGSLNHALCRLF